VERRRVAMDISRGRASPLAEGEVETTAKPASG
jgi:hypothetical protein